MIKHEIKVELLKSKELIEIIEKAYYKDGFGGKITNTKKHYITIDESDDVNYTIFKGLNNGTVKVLNDEIIDGPLRFLIDETQGEIRLYPISIYCIIDEGKYSFY